MYYVIIRKPETNPVEVMGFKTPKYLTNKISDTVIFEFNFDDKVIRKWIKKSEILLLTNDKDFYLQTLKTFEQTFKEQSELVSKAQKKVDKSIEEFSAVMEEKIGEFEKLRNTDGVPCILKDL